MSPRPAVGSHEGDHDASDSRITRNWDELLQELRVAQTGVQILTGFLLTVPFSNRFSRLTELQRVSYLCVLLGSIGATALLVAPVALHRVLFRHHARPWLVRAANVCAIAGLSLLGFISCGSVFLVFDFVTSTPVAIGVGAGLFAVFGGLWVAVPLSFRMRHRDRSDSSQRTVH